MKKIFLIGYMGAGKTTIGKCLAKKLNMQFIDLDAFIENRYHKTVSEIFAGKGENEFRKMEKTILHEVTQFENVVIATGGGTPCFFDNMAVMNKSGTTIYLKVSVDELDKRLNAFKEKRPLINDKKAEELKAFISGNLEKREPFYNQATCILDAEKMNDDEDIYAIINQLDQYLSVKKTILNS